MNTLLEYRKRTQNVLWSLHPDFYPKAFSWWVECDKAGLHVLVYTGWRSPEEQERLWRTNRNSQGEKVGKTVTDARAGQSYHNFGFAFDWVPLMVNPKELSLWDTQWNNTGLYALGDSIAKQAGLKVISWETGHLQDAAFPTWKALAEKYPVHIPTAPVAS